MKLNLVERFEVLRLLPEQGSFATLNIVANMRKSLAPTEEEFKEFEIRQEGDQIFWNPILGAEEREIKIGEKATDIIVDALKKLDKEQVLGNQHLSIYMKFIEQV